METKEEKHDFKCPTHECYFIPIDIFTSVFLLRRQVTQNELVPLVNQKAFACLFGVGVVRPT